jgi:tetratricopeptide (TPR) repeat protein
MKFKPIYLYGLIFIIAIIVLLVMSQQSNQRELVTDEFNTDQEIPDDETHKKYNARGDEKPSEENVSEEYHKKLSEFKETVEQNPNDTIAIRSYADFLSAAHQNEEAIVQYQKILNIDPSRKDIYFSLALINYNLGKFSEAENLNKKILEIDPDNLMARYNIGALAATRGDKDKAREMWNKIIKESPDSETGKLASQSLERL